MRDEQNLAFMPIDKIITDLQRLDELIRRRQTGTPKELAKKFAISSRTLYRRIDFLSSLDVPIVYDEFLQSYKYEYEGKLEVNIRFVRKE